jgi:uncharacterized protein (DUF1800 family)
MKARAVSLLLSLTLFPSGSWSSTAPADDDIVHALNRLGYGPRPGDVEKVKARGLLKWIDLQLHPERIPDRPVEVALSGVKTLGMTSQELMRGYELPREARREIQMKTASLGDGASETDMQKVRKDVAERYRPGMEGAPRQIIDDLQAAKLIRAVSSERQLNEVLVDFWMNHFNVFAEKGEDRYLLTEYEREVIRPRAWGKFEDLLLATARSPAMLFYLDNWLSADPNAPDRARVMRGRFGYRPAMRPEQQRPKRGLNENYAREIMELHTLGVEGGYTQKDVTELARVLTGWTIRGLNEQRPEFFFDSRLHDPGNKLVLGQEIRGDGQGEGERVIHMLATHPATAHFISLKLARRFVSDEPPKALVDRAANTFLRTHGDIRGVVMEIVTSPEFFAPAIRAAKVKTPLEFVVSAVRAYGANVDETQALARRIAEMGMPLYMQQPPTGYKDVAEAWVSTGGLLARLNFALDLAGGRIKGIRADTTGLAPHAPDAQALTESLAARLVPAGLSESTRKTLDDEVGAGLNPPRIAGLILGSPEFQRK